MACGGDKDCATRVSPLTNEEPLVVVETCIYIVREVIRKDCGDGRDSVIGDRETPLCRSGYGSVRERASSTEDRDVGRVRGTSGHRGSEIFAARGGDKDVVGVNGDIFMRRGEEESVEDFLGY